MATRMQQRRGTAAQWTSANPILNAGEMGWESDTNKFKIGDGTNHWANLDYFIDQSSTVNPSFGSSITFEGATADSYETTLQVTDPTDDRTITLPNVSGTVITTGNLSDITDIGVFTSTIVMEGSSADDFELTLSAGNPTADRTITFPDATGTVALTSDIAELSQDAIDTALTAGTGITKTYNDNANTLTLAVDTTTIQARVADVSDTEIGYLNGVTSAIQTQLDAKAPTANASFTGTFSAPSGTITSTMIADGTIVNDDISASAAIAYSKLNLSGSITSSDITNGAITNDDINASAAIALSKLATDPLARANHSGTQTASTISDFDTQVRTSRLDQMAVPTASVSLNSQKVTNLATPTDSTDAATKAYVDGVTEGLHIHAAVVAATTANVALATDLENGDTLDGIVLATGNRILVKNQTTTSENGIYVVQASGQPTRATDFDTAAEVDSGDFVFVYSGTVNGSTGWVQTNQPATIGTDPIVFTQFSGAGTYTAGTGLTLTGTVFSINTGTTVDLSTSQTLTNKTLTSPVITGLTLNDGSMVFEGATANDFETTLQVTDPTADRTLTLPDATDTLVGRATTDTLSNKSISLASNTITGTLAEFNTALSDANFATIDGSETLSNKTLASAISTTSLTLNATAELRLADTDSSHYVGFKAPETVTTNRIWTLPAADGTSGQTLSTDGSGALSWSTPSAGAAFSEMMLIGA